MGIINSMLDTDLYTLTVMYFYMSKMPRAIGTYTFCDRNKMVFPEGFAAELKKECIHMESLSFKDSEIEFLKKTMYYMPPFFFDYLKSVKFDASMLSINQDEDGLLSVEAVGPLYKAVIWEVPLLATISELYYRMSGIREAYDVDTLLDDVNSKAIEKTYKLINNGVRFSEFGTRRRASFAVQDAVLDGISFASGVSGADTTFSGTSNLFFAKKYNLKPIGTMSHQLVSAVGALFGYNEANYLSMQWWQEVFNADLGIFLADTYTTEAFLNNFTKMHAKLLDGVRQDSGCPYVFTSKIVNKYIELGIDPKTKAITYSDGLDIDKAIAINSYAKNLIKPQFGIGTHFTNNIEGVKPCNIVMKLTKVKLTEKTAWKNCIKLSDSKGKYMGDEATINSAIQTLGL